MTTEPYCITSDLMLGNIPIPTDAQKYVDLAAEEIDSKIGFKYATPVVVGSSPEERPTTLLLKKINAWLASGRLIMAKDAGGEDDQLHQYGFYLVNEAMAALNAIVDGSVVLPGATPATPDDNLSSAPIISNVDASSAVEDFACVFGSPAQQVLAQPRYPYATGNPYTW
jgi:hypothetical protein